MSEFRRSSVEFHLRQLQEIAQARRKADLAAEAAEAAKGAAVAVPPVKP
jgi:DNA-binding CsgD family transcriptional regulator